MAHSWYIWASYHSTYEWANHRIENNRSNLGFINIKTIEAKDGGISKDSILYFK